MVRAAGHDGPPDDETVCSVKLGIAIGAPARRSAPVHAQQNAGTGDPREIEQVMWGILGMPSTATMAISPESATALTSAAGDR